MNYYIEKIENGELFALCLNTVIDDDGIYCEAGKEYEIIDYINDEDSKECFIIDIGSENEDTDVLQFRIDDKDFKIIVK